MLNKISDRIYYMPHRQKGDRPVLGLIVGNKYSMIVDSGNSPKHAKAFLKDLKSLDISPIAYLVLTHYHWDHVFGIEDMECITIANEQTKEELKKMKKLKFDDESLKHSIKQKIFSEFAVECIKEEIIDRENFKIGEIDITYKDTLEVDLGGVTCFIKHVDNPHTDDCAIIYIPEEKTIFLGDCLYGRRHKGLYMYEKDKLFSLINTIESYDAEHYILSHESLFNRSQILDLWNDFKIASEVVGDRMDCEESIKAFISKYHKEPSEDVRFYVECFVNENKAKYL